MQGKFVEFLKNSGDVSHLPQGSIVGVTARDPRLFLPKKKSLIDPNQDDIESGKDGNNFYALANFDE